MNIALITWRYGSMETGWVPWGCFDQLLHPQRISATNLSSYGIEVYAIANERLRVRNFRVTAGYWSPWTSLGLTPSNGARDIAALGYPLVDETELYLATESRLYQRRRISSDDDADFGTWSKFAEEALRAVAVGLTPSGERWVVGVSSSGRLLATDSESNETVSMVSFGSIEADAVDIAAGYEADQDLFFLVAGSDGSLWRRDVPGENSEWIRLKGAQPPKIRAITVGSSEGYAPILFAVGGDGEVFRSLNGSSWTIMQ